jgi:pimeloyl-ACP methyl ester carboxylesterase
MSYPAQAKALASFISGHVPDNPMIIGHSMGGKVAMALALEGGISLARLVVVDIAPVAYPHSHRSLVASMKALDLAALRNRRDAERALESDIPDKAFRQFLLQNLRSVEGGLRWRINLDVIHRQMDALTGFDIAPGCSNIPALFVYGTQSDYVTPQITPRIMDRFPNARLHAIQEAGHWLHAEKPSALIDALKDFAETAES